MVIEQMSDFFTARVDGYDEHMLHSDKGCKEQRLVPLMKIWRWYILKNEQTVGLSGKGETLKEVEREGLWLLKIK